MGVGLQKELGIRANAATLPHDPEAEMVDYLLT